MLSDEAFVQWCQRLALSEEARTIITLIRTSPPSRRVQGRAGNVSGQYPSRKMGFGIQFESRHNELAAITLMEHDPAVLEYYDLMNDNINSRYRQLEMPMRKGNPVATQHRKLERSMRMVVRGSGRCGGMRNSKNERRRCGNNPPHFDRLRW